MTVSVVEPAEPDDAGTGGEVAVEVVIVGPVSVAGSVLEAIDMLSDDPHGFTQNRVTDSHSLLLCSGSACMLFSTCAGHAHSTGRRPPPGLHRDQ